MKKMITILAASVILVTGCSAEKESSVKTDSSASVPAAGTDVYTAYQESGNSRPSADSWTVSAICRYDLYIDEDSMISYALDGILEVNNSEDPAAYLQQYINSDGMTSSMEGYYYGGRLYNSYNGITYYEDMSLSDIEETMLVPTEPYIYSEEQIDLITSEEDSSGNITYTVTLSAEAASSMFTARYDIYDLDEQEDYKVESGIVVNTYDKDGFFISEKADFVISVTVSGTPVEVVYSGEVNYMQLNDTVIEISDDMKAEHSAYVAFNDIDTDAIDVSDISDDSEEETVTDTFRKRIVSRLGYELQDDGSYKASFNDTEAYVINFDNCTFEYSNYSITYSYSWRNQVGSMGACTYTFEDEQRSSSCEDSTVETIQDVESYLEMELYYCGLSLEDLQNESKK